MVIVKPSRLRKVESRTEATETALAGLSALEPGKAAGTGGLAPAGPAPPLRLPPPPDDMCTPPAASVRRRSTGRVEGAATAGCDDGGDMADGIGATSAAIANTRLPIMSGRRPDFGGPPASPRAARPLWRE
eukprot:scaffold10653_cov82-Isochrysis_galbana.AAC.2